MNKKWQTNSIKVITAKLDTRRVLAIALAALAASLMLLKNADAAFSKAGGYACEDRLSNLYLAGSFVMPNSGELMHLWVGKPRTALAGADVWGIVGKAGAGECEAQCKVTRFERFKKDMKPALMELSCEGTRLKTMRMPLHVQWIREKKGFDTVVRLGSSIYGMEQAPLRVQVNRYNVASK